MKLVACPVCHTQYDVSQVAAERIDCRCGESIENRVHTAVDAVVARCGSCGAQVGSETKSCDYCGSEIVRELDELSLICPECFARNTETCRFCTACGVAFAPEALISSGSELPCPACDTRMPPSQVAGTTLNECPGCHGLWIPGDHFDALVQRAARAREERIGTAADAPRSRGANPMSQELKYRRCPECDHFMLRVNYARTSGVILDQCRSHGTWLDADELEQVAGFILAGGRTTAELEIERRQQNAKAVSTKLERDATLAAVRARQGAPVHRSYDPHLDVGALAARGLVHLLRRIFD